MSYMSTNMLASLCPICQEPCLPLPHMLASLGPSAKNHAFHYPTCWPVCALSARNHAFHYPTYNILNILLKHCIFTASLSLLNAQHLQPYRSVYNFTVSKYLYFCYTTLQLANMCTSIKQNSAFFFF